MNQQDQTVQAEEMEAGLPKRELNAARATLRAQQEREQWQVLIEEAELALRRYGPATAYQEMKHRGIARYPEHLQVAVAGIAASQDKPRPEPMLVEAVRGALARIPEVDIGQAEALLAQQKAVIEGTSQHYNWTDELRMLENAQLVFAVRKQTPPQRVPVVVWPDDHIVYNGATGEVRVRRD